VTDAPARATVLVVDDEESQRYFLRRALARRGFAVREAADGRSGLAAFETGGVDCVVLDVRLPDLNGAAVLDRILALQPDQPVVMMTAFAEVADAVAALQRGAADYLTKPVTGEQVAAAIARACEGRAARAAAPARREAMAHGAAFGQMLGASPAMQPVFRDLAQAAQSDATILLLGESGTGKELAAHEVHRRSRRAGGPFVPVFCAGVPPTLLAGELFGVATGAFTGARARPGHFRRADGGTIFLDEIGELPPDAQAVLLRVLAERTITALGSERPEAVDVRVVAATNRDLDAECAAGRFREDLYYRLNVVPITLPPLRERRDDIPLLARHFLAAARGGEGDRGPGTFSVEAMVCLRQYRWPGNVRELRNVVERVAALHDVEEVALDHLPEALRADALGVAPESAAGASPLRDALAEFERRYLEQLLTEVAGNVSEAARRAGVSRPSIHRKLKEHRLDADAYRREA
jgi:DNA-binding NtrC family response regulator